MTNALIKISFGGERIYLSQNSRAQYIIEGNQGKKLKGGPLLTQAALSLYIETFFIAKEVQELWKMLAHCQTDKCSWLSYMVLDHLPKEWFDPQWAGLSYIN